MRKIEGWKKRLCMLMAVLLMAASLHLDAVEALAAVQPVMMKVTYGQTEARGMLADINAFRTSEVDAWYWNESDSEKVWCELEELQYDYELERIAMKRAAEIALSFSHTRPDNTDCFTAYSSSYRTMGENIAAGQTSAKEVFKAWQETEEKYAGQGHRRNMLSENYQAIGIGHVVYQGCHYWVQEFGDKAADTTLSTADDTEQTVTVNVDSSNITAATAKVKDITVKEGEKVIVDKISLSLTIRKFFGYKKGCAVENACTVKLEDETIASISEDLVLTGLKEGTTKMVVSNPFGEAVTAAITVTKKDGGSDKSEAEKPAADSDKSESDKTETDKSESDKTESGKTETDKSEDKVVVHTTRLKISDTKVTLKVGKTYRLRVYVNKGSVDKVTYQTSNKKIATISSKGVIKGVKEGTAKITVKSGTKKKVCTVVVKKDRVIKLDKGIRKKL